VGRDEFFADVFVVIFGAFINGMGGYDMQCITRERNRDGVNSIAGRFGGWFISECIFMFLFSSTQYRTWD
jgi:hypothetical protein